MRSGWNAAGRDRGVPGALEGYGVGGCRLDRSYRIARRRAQPHIGQGRRRCQGTAGCFAALDHGPHLVGVGNAGRHIDIGEGQTAEALAEGLRGGAVVAGKRVSNAWGGCPVGRVHRGPAQAHLTLPRSRRQGRPFPKLVAELLPCRRIIPIEIHHQRRILVGLPEVPEVSVPVRIDAGGVGGRLELRGCLARSVVTGRLPRGQRVPVAVRNPAPVVVPGQPADKARTRNTTRGVAGPDLGDVVPDQAADLARARYAACGVVACDGGDGRSDQATDCTWPRHADGRKAGRDRAEGRPDQTADMARARHAAGRKAGRDRAGVLSDQAADVQVSRHIDLGHSDVANGGRRVGISKQPDPRRCGSFNEQVANDVPVAFEPRLESGGTAPNGVPAGAVVPIVVV